MIPAALAGSNVEDNNMETYIAASIKRQQGEDDTSTTTKQDAKRAVLEQEACTTIEKKRLREKQRRHEISQAVDCLFEAMVQIDPQVMDAQVLHAVLDKEQNNKRRKTTDAEVMSTIVAFQQRGSLNRTDVITGARDMLFRQDDRIKKLEDELRLAKVASSASFEPIVKDISTMRYAGKGTKIGNPEEDFFRNEGDKNINKAVGNVHNINDATTGNHHDITNTPFQLLRQEAKQRQKLQQQVSSSSSFVAPGRYSTDASSCPSPAPNALLLMQQQQQAAAASRTNSSQQQQQRDDPRYFHGGLNPNNMHNLLERTRQQQQYSRRHQFSPYQHTSTATSSSGYNTQEGSLFARTVPMGIGRSMYESVAGLNDGQEQGFASTFARSTGAAAANPAGGMALFGSSVNPSSRPYAAENDEQLDAIFRSLQQRQQQEQHQLSLVRSALGVGPDYQLTMSDAAAFFSGNHNVGGSGGGSGH